MGRLLNIVTPLHKRTKRDYLARMVDDKVHCMVKAKEYEFDYWDGDRRYGYGGYKYDGRWKTVAEKLIADLRPEARRQDPRRGLRQGPSALRVAAVAARVRVRRLRHLPARPGRRPRRHPRHLFRYRAQDAYPFGDQYFDLVISLGCLHNLRIFELKTALAGIQRVGRTGTSCWKATATSRNCSTCSAGP